ncbi:LCP family protein [Parenemella sanctibonifatiensis]|uniref:LCP family protein n=1 Tax=Parenemella sanctibonifatiensis TaxID=2016505 RepID=UPI0015C669F9|nr:LCP family protein [Parenemella sanctibonifatiensis]
MTAATPRPTRDHPRGASSSETSAPENAVALSSGRIKLRRALVLIAMTVMVPGSAQLAAGNRTVGRWGMRVWGGFLALVAILVLIGFSAPSVLVEWATQPWLVQLMAVVVVIAAIGWALLIVDAWRIANPPDLSRQHRPGFALLAGGLAFAIMGGSVFAAGTLSSHAGMIGEVFGGGGETEAQAGRYNVLLLGVDATVHREGIRPDSITVASVDEETGRTVLISLPRNLQKIPFPQGSPMRQEFPNGFDCPDNECMLNAVHTYAENRHDLYPDADDPGLAATIDAVTGATGLNINYFALIDMAGFEALVDAVGGIRMDINQAVPIGGGGQKVESYVGPGEDLLLNGYEALWVARSRVDSSDYARMQRQKCVMAAMLNQLDPVTVATKFQDLAAAGKQIVRTNVPPDQIDDLMKLAGGAQKLPLRSVMFTPPAITPHDPDFARMHQMVADEIAVSERLDAERAEKDGGEKAPEQSPETADAPADESPADEPPASDAPAADAPRDEPADAPPADPQPEGAGGNTDDLGEVCAAR